MKIIKIYLQIHSFISAPTIQPWYTFGSAKNCTWLTNTAFSISFITNGIWIETRWLTGTNSVTVLLIQGATHCCKKNKLILEVTHD